mgnify:CR=1 FL=1
MVQIDTILIKKKQYLVVEGGDAILQTCSHRTVGGALGWNGVLTWDGMGDGMMDK